MKEEKKPHGADVCACGDYRSEHDENGCRVCKNSTAPYDGCDRFRLHRYAAKEEIEHWRLSHEIRG